MTTAEDNLAVFVGDYGLIEHELIGFPRRPRPQYRDGQKAEPVATARHRSRQSSEEE